MHGLALALRLNEAFQIGDGITVKLIESGGRRARLLIDAPRKVRIRRIGTVPGPDNEKREMRNGECTDGCENDEDRRAAI